MVKIFIKTDKLFVTAGPNMLQTGWYGGQWVKYVGNRTVELSDKATYAGFMKNGYKLTDIDGKSYDYDDTESDTALNFIPHRYENKSIKAYGQSVMISGGGDFDFNKNAYDTTKTYVHNQKLYVNDNAVLTNVDSGNPSIGVVSMIPSDNEGNWLGMALKY